jgi:Putative porin
MNKLFTARRMTLPMTALASALLLGATPRVLRADEVSELKAAVQALQKRLDQLETRAQVTEDTNDHQTDQIAQAKSSVGAWVSNFTWKGDFRYRNEDIDQEFVRRRNRDRIRVRAGFVAKVNDTVRTELEFSTAEGGDPRSPNQSLTGENTRKGIYIDLAYAEWQPRPEWKVTGGKMKYPWVRPGQSVLFDGDINPEGLAVNYGKGNFFASTFYNILEERSTLGESTLGGGQAGWRPTFGPNKLVLGVSYFDFNSVQGRNPFFSGSNGNSTTTTSARCKGVTPCLTQGYELWEGFAELSRPVAGRPLVVYTDYFKNNAADNGLDTAYSVGVQYGKASDPRTWEIGYFYQKVEKDALFGQFVDSDWGAGNTDAQGSVLKFGYAFAKNWVFNGAYQFSKTNIDAPVTVAGVGSVFDRDYKRLQLDLNFKY